MKTHVIVKELEEIARQLGLVVRKGKGNFKGGRCIVEGKDMIVLNKHHVPEFHLSVLAEGIRDLPVDTIFMKPAVRKALEAAWDALEEDEKDQSANDDVKEKVAKEDVDGS